jgi:glycosyltransferase involved in cell wall biosynthesis
MSLSPTVSVVIPTYNQPALLLETLATVFAQTFTDYEVIIINDGSTDDTAAQLEPLQQLHSPRLRVITQPNAGIGAARNRGLDEARGKYVALLDHDDLWMPEKLAVQVEFMQQHPQCAACGTLFALSTTPDKPHFLLADVANAEGIVERPFWQTVHNKDVFQTCTLMIDRDRCQGLRYATRRGAIEDVSFHLTLLGRGEYGMAGDKILAIYRVFDGNASKAAGYYYHGVAVLRGLQRGNHFRELPPLQRQDMRLWIGHLGRVAAVQQVNQGRRGRAASLYLREFIPQLLDRRMRFLLLFPMMLCLPRSAIAFVYRNKH